MTKDKLIEKNLKLSADFNSYVASYPDTVKDIPNNAYVFFESKRDKEFSSKNRSLAQKLKEKGRKCFVAIKEGKKWVVAVL